MPTNGVDRVYLARHGHTALNADGRLRGLSYPPLDEAGQVEAKRLAKALAAFGPMAVISSPLQLLSGLTVEWRGPSSVMMTAAAAPYTAWISATAGQVEQTATQARAAASAFETAFEATVAPPVVAANDPSPKSFGAIARD
jgi:hypothetical protein